MAEDGKVNNGSYFLPENIGKIIKKVRIAQKGVVKMTTTEARRAIFRCIVQAQIASDAGKDICHLWPGRIRNYNRLVRDGYKEKDRLLKMAVSLIAQFPEAEIDYFYTRDNENYPYFNLIYFSYELDDKKYQVSFHTPDMITWHSPDKYHVCWDQKSSRDNCWILAEEVF